MPAEKAFASFDSASAMHASLSAALRGQQFWHLGQGRLTATRTRVGGQLPWPLLRRIYARIGAAEGIPADRVGDIDLADVAAWLTGQLPPGPGRSP